MTATEKNSSTPSIYAMDRLATGRRPRLRESGSRRENRSRCRYYCVSHPNNFDLKKFSSRDNLYRAWEKLKLDGGHGAGIDGLVFEHFSPGELWGCIRQISSALNRMSYLPKPTREVAIPKAGGRFRELRLQTLSDRTISKALQLCLDDYFRSFLPGIGQDVFDLYAKMQIEIRARHSYVLAIDDVRDCFPSTPIMKVIDLFGQHINNQPLLWLVRQIVQGHDGPDHLKGLDQGSPFSPLAMELFLHHYLDTELGTRSRGNPLVLLRYVDNVTLLCNSEREGLEILNVSNEILNQVGLQLKGEDGPPVDIRDMTHEKVILGLIPRWQNGELTLSIPDSAYENLQRCLSRTMSQPNPQKCIDLVMGGWIRSKGPALTTKVAPEVVYRIMETGNEIGIKTLSRQELLNQSKIARKRWLNTTSP